jgi:hypothetical protein
MLMDDMQNRPQNAGHELEQWKEFHSRQLSQQYGFQSVKYK